jgi:hypothetical protein
MHGHEGQYAGENNWLLFKHEDDYADHEWELTQILHYGSRAQSPARKKIATAKKTALKTLLKQSRTKPKRKTARKH